MNLRYERKKPQNVDCIHGNIIWAPEERQTYYETPQNSHCLFRKEFFVEGDIEKADLNVFAAEVLYYGYGTGYSISRIPALWIECNIDFKNSNRMIVATDSSWKTFLPETFNRSAPRVNGCKGPIEIWDMREE